MKNYPRSAKIGNLEISPPWMNASGALGTPPELQRCSGYMVGAVESKTLQTTEEKGNESPIYADDGRGNGWNSVGLSGQGVYKLCGEMRGYPLRPGKKFVISITSKRSLDDLKEAAAQVLTLADAFDMLIELSGGCPNVKNGMVVGKDQKMSYEWVDTIKRMADCVPVMYKMTPNVDDATYVDVMAACADAGADALVMINTVAEAYVNPHTGQPHFKFGGGRSGHDVFGENVRHVEMAQNMRSNRGYKFAIGSVGGIDTSERAKICFDAGADFLQFFTYAFQDRPMELKRRTQPELETVKEFLERMHREVYGD